MPSSIGVRRLAADNVFVAFLFFFTAWLGQTLAFPPFVASVVCPASGVALAATVLRGLHVWPGVLLGTAAILIKVLIIGGGVPVGPGLACSLLVGVAGALQAYIGGRLFQRWVADPAFSSPGSAFRYTFVAIISAAIGSTGAVAALIGFDFVKADLLPEITIWSVGRTAGMMIFTPAILLCASVRDCKNLKARFGEWIILLASVTIVTTMVFGLSTELERHYPLEYIIFPGLLWALVRFGNRELAVLVALVSVIATFATAQGLGPFAIGNNPNESLTLMELYFGVMTISTLLGGAVAAQRNRAQSELEAARHGLEERVAERTKQLSHANNDLQAEIAERLRTLEKLRLLAKAFEHSGEPALITDADLRVVSINPAFTAVTGYTAAEIEGRHLRTLASQQKGQDRYDQLLIQLRGKGEAKGELPCRRSNGSTFPAWVSVATVRDPSGSTTQHVITLSDITEQKAAEERVAFLAHHDALTGLPNRVSLKESLERAIAYARRLRTRFAVMFVDLDHFKPINDTYGHAVGDRLLKAVVERLSLGMRGDDTLARLGGDEFVLLLSDLCDDGHLARTAQWVREELARPFHIDGHELQISASLGISLFPDHGRSVEELLEHADTAMYHAKETSRNAYQIYSPNLEIRNERRNAMENSIRTALERDGLRLVYQPQFDLQSGSLRGVEALLRLSGPDGRWLIPADFLPFAEETSLILPMDKWALREACQQLCQWKGAGLPDFRVTVNLSPLHFQHRCFVEELSAILDETGVDPRFLELDLAESVIMSESAIVQGTLQQLRNLGVRLAADDFGSGNSSLSRLMRAPLDRIKLNCTVMQGNDNRALVAMIDAMVTLGHGLGFAVNVGGVENEALAALLRGRMCDEVQGDYYCPPLAADRLAAWLAAPPSRQPDSPAQPVSSVQASHS